MITLYAFSGDIAHTQINYFKMEMLHEPYDTLQLQISKSIQIWLGACKSCCLYMSPELFLKIQSKVFITFIENLAIPLCVVVCCFAGHTDQ